MTKSAKIKLNVNLDAVAGAPYLTLITSNIQNCRTFLQPQPGP